MTEAEFRVMHSQLIEYFQYIEFHMKAICADLLADEQKSWFEHLNDYESDSLGTMLREIRSLQVEKKVNLLTQEDLDTLEEMRKTRNYWVHQCFSGIPHISFRKGELRYAVHGERLRSDLQRAIEWDEKITEIGRAITK